MPCTYCDASYNEILRWYDNTPIKYGPNPKQKTSKSFVRYAKYAKAKTAGEALRLGSFYLDLLFDHEHGHLKCAGQPRRKELVSPHRSDWTDKWTNFEKVISKMHLKWITWKKTFEVADKLGVDRRNLTNNKMCGISVEMHANRMRAQVLSKLILDEADKHSMPVTGQDVTQVLRLWAFRQNFNRLNVMQEGVEFVHSDTLGLLSGYDGTVLVNHAAIHYPAVPKLFGRWLRDNMPEEMKATGFKYTSINVNANYAGKLHRDGNNEGPSMISAFGDFEGGELNYWPEDDKNKATIDKLVKEDRVTLDLKKNLLLFDGNRGHEVNDFKGERFSLVYFSIGKNLGKVTEKQLKRLADAGIDHHTEGSLDAMKSYLSPPLGYGKHTEPAEKGRHPYRSWRLQLNRKPVVNRLSKKTIEEAHEAAKFVEPPEEDDGAAPETCFIGHKFDRLTRQDGLKVLKVYMKGPTGRLALAATGVEEAEGTAKFRYEKVPSFDYGRNFETHRLADVRLWMQEVIKETGGEGKEDLTSNIRKRQPKENTTPSAQNKKRMIETTPKAKAVSNESASKKTKLGTTAGKFAKKTASSNLKVLGAGRGRGRGRGKK